jgi:L-arabinokinase
MNVFKQNKMPIPVVVGRNGRDRGDELREMFGIDPAKRIGLIYTGNFGLDNVRWGKLEKFDGWEFMGVYPLPGNPKNYHLVTKDWFRYQDLPASADVIIGKMGYGVFTESLMNGVPLIYLPRSNFAEFPALDAEAKRLGSGVCIDNKDFADLVWDGILDEVVKNNKLKPARGDGARLCAQEILKMAS